MMAGDEDRPSTGEPKVTPPEGPIEAAAPSDTGPTSVGEGSIDLAAAERPAESFGEPAYGAAAPMPQGPRPIMPAVLGAIGLVLILLLVVNLYTLYNPPVNDQIPALQAAVAEVHRQLAAVPRVDVAPLEGRVATLSTALGALRRDMAQGGGAAQAAAEAKAAVGPLAARVDELDKRILAVQGGLDAVPKVDLGPLEARAAELDKRLMPLETYFAAPKAGTQATEARQNGSGAETRAAPLAVIAQGVLDALAAGRPFDPEAKALAALGIKDEVRQPLDAVAASGAATQADLLSGFTALRDGIVVAAAPVSTGTVLDRMMANAQNLVKVSRTGAGAGPDADAASSRIEADLRRGALGDAAAGWDALPEASRARSADWAARLKARIAAEAAARTIETDAVAALAAAQH